MIIFTDLETTGLSASRHRVLEAAVIATDDKFVELGRFTAVAHWAPAQQLQTARADRAIAAAFWGVDPYVLDMHTKNGLWSASAASTLSLADVDRLVAGFVAEVCAAHGVTPGEKTGPQLAGNTINFDRAFLQVDLPQTHALLHYRNVDVTTLNEMARRFWPEVHAARPRAGNTHRAAADVAESLETARYYAARLAPVGHPITLRVSSPSPAEDFELWMSAMQGLRDMVPGATVIDAEHHPILLPATDRLDTGTAAKIAAWLIATGSVQHDRDLAAALARGDWSKS